MNVEHKLAPSHPCKQLALHVILGLYLALQLWVA